jgi:hypothetical protein
VSGWPKGFTAKIGAYTAREWIIGRDTPPGLNPRCCWCGLFITGGGLDVHHLLHTGRGGRGDPRNGATVHHGCHMTIHDREPALAAARGLDRSQYGHPDGLDPYGQPLRCAWRGWITLLGDFPWQRPAELDEVRAWYGTDVMWDQIGELLRPPGRDPARRAELTAEFRALAARYGADPELQQRIAQIIAEEED